MVSDEYIRDLQNQAYHNYDIGYNKGLNDGYKKGFNDGLRKKMAEEGIIDIKEDEDDI